MGIVDKIEHAIVSLGCFLAGVALEPYHPGAALGGAALGAGIFIGREHGAAAWNLRFNEGWMGESHLATDIEALKFWKWRLDNFFDMLVPVVANAVAYAVYAGVYS